MTEGAAFNRGNISGELQSGHGNTLKHIICNGGEGIINAHIGGQIVVNDIGPGTGRGYSCQFQLDFLKVTLIFQGDYCSLQVLRRIIRTNF